MSTPPARFASLWFGILAPPLAWSAQELVCYGFVNPLCRLRPEAQTAAAVPPFMLVTIAAFAIAFAGLWVAVGNWRRLGDVQSRDAGAERTRFLARIALIDSGGFIAALLFSSATLVAAPLCGK